MNGREGRAERAGRVSRVALGGARPPGRQGFSPRPLSACETPLARSHRRSVSALPDQSHYSHVARRPGAVTLTGRWATAGKRSGEGARSHSHPGLRTLPAPPLLPLPLGRLPYRALLPGQAGRLPAQTEARRAAGPRARGGALPPPRGCAPAGAARLGLGPGAGGRREQPRRQSAGRLWRAGRPRWQARAARLRASPSCRFPVSVCCLLSFSEEPRTCSK
ncbi:uncharacterized protein LOC106629487 [Zonotrichia albicollis]|uniref:uncharacterized protein LOC106629487 n=1 Tax=Zonotrichia albicollis TaxID=44394 RepID=UPI003D80F878